MSFDDDFGDIFDDFDIFRLMKKSSIHLDRILEGIKNGEIKGQWKVQRIDEPNVKGYAMRGVFGTELPLQPLEPIEPLKPTKRRPSPERPFEVPKAALKEMREPLIDVFDDNQKINIYVELPGVDKDEVKLSVREGFIEIKARNFYKRLEMPHIQVHSNSVSTNYKNGVLQITLSKTRELRDKDAKNLKAI